MRKVLSHGSQTVELVRAGEAAPVETAVALSSRSSAVAFLRAFTRDPLNITTLRRALAGEIGHQRVGRLSDAAVVDQLATQISRGRLQVALHGTSRAVVKPPPREAWQRAKPKEEEPVVLESTTGPAPEPKTGSWIRFRVVDDATGKPVAGVTLSLKLPDGKTQDVTSGGDGRIEVKGLVSGTCDIQKMSDGEGWEVVQIG